MKPPEKDDSSFAGHSSDGADISIRSMEKIERDLEELPQKVAVALWKWDISIAERERQEALAYIKYDGQGIKPVKKIEAMIDIDDDVIKAKYAEADARKIYKWLEERHLSNKKRADLRTNY